jgi:hypothetical protein
VRSFDYFGLDRRLLQIASPRFDEATRVVAGASDRRAAWEALVAAGLLPASWAASDRRTFTSAHGPRRREEPYPRALDAARIAGAAQLMVAVEELADRIAVALDPWGQPRPERIVWRLLPPGRLKQRWIRSIHAACEPMHLADLCATNSLSDTAAWSDAASLSSQRGRDAAQRVFAHDVAMHAAWRHAVDVGAEVPPGPFGQVLVPGEGYRPLRAPEALVGRSRRSPIRCRRSWRSGRRGACSPG